MGSSDSIGFLSKNKNHRQTEKNTNLISAPISVVSSTYLGKKKNQANLRNLNSFKKHHSTADENNSLNTNNIIIPKNSTVNNNENIMSINSQMPSTMKLPALNSRPWVSNEQAARNRAKFDALKAQNNGQTNQDTKNGIKINGANTDLLIQESLNNFTLGKVESIGSKSHEESRKKSPTLKDLANQQNMGFRQENILVNQNNFFENTLVPQNPRPLPRASNASVSSQLLGELNNESTSKEFSSDLLGALDQVFSGSEKSSGNQSLNNPFLIQDSNNNNNEKCEIPVPQPRKNWVQFD